MAESLSGFILSLECRTLHSSIENNKCLLIAGACWTSSRNAVPAPLRARNNLWLLRPRFK
jgi:hypothetical protein